MNWKFLSAVQWNANGDVQLQHCMETVFFQLNKDQPCPYGSLLNKSCPSAELNWGEHHPMWLCHFWFQVQLRNVLIRTPGCDADISSDFFLILETLQEFPCFQSYPFSTSKQIYFLKCSMASMFALCAMPEDAGEHHEYLSILCIANTPLT